MTGAGLARDEDSMRRQTSAELSPGRLAVAIVAPSLSIPSGQAVQASRLVQAWGADSEVTAFLVPVNAAPPRWLRPLARIKRVRDRWMAFYRALSAASVLAVRARPV
jgi:hypothetical protein